MLLCSYDNTEALGSTVTMAFGSFSLDFFGTEASFKKCWNVIVTQMRIPGKHTHILNKHLNIGTIFVSAHSQTLSVVLDTHNLSTWHLSTVWSCVLLVTPGKLVKCPWLASLGAEGDEDSTDTDVLHSGTLQHASCFSK